MEMQTEARFEGRFIRFGVALFSLSRQLPHGPIVRHVADQLFRSGSSAAANVMEAQSAQSPADFITKMAIALKEIREARYWPAVATEGALLPQWQLASVIQECEELTAILIKSVITAKAKWATWVRKIRTKKSSQKAEGKNVEGRAPWSLFSTSALCLLT